MVLVMDGGFFIISSDTVELEARSSSTTAAAVVNVGLDGDEPIDILIVEVNDNSWDTDRLIQIYITVATIATILTRFQ